jgi:formylmethanofuran:tetrahydromethanopterin formyltransferase
MAAIANIYIDQSTDYSIVIDTEDDNENPFPLDGFTAKCQMRKSYYTSTAYDIPAAVFGTPANGQIQLALTPAESAAFKPGRYVYDVIVRNGDDSVVKRVVEGIATVRPATTSLL